MKGPIVMLAAFLAASPALAGGLVGDPDRGERIYSARRQKGVSLLTARSPAIPYSARLRAGAGGTGLSRE